MKNLPDLLTPHEYKTLDYPTYFADFLLDKRGGCFDNNSGQDLRNFRRFLGFAQSHGSSTVYIGFG
ncbi:MAG: hypothetical protein ACRYFX_07395 [Janthinobacterium lividum]